MRMPARPSPARRAGDVNAGHRKLPLLVTQSYGHGRTAVLATGGTWRWQMSEALGDPSHDLFWQQLLRWLVADSPGPVAASMPARMLMDEGRVQLTAQVRDRQFQPAADAHVTAHIIGPRGREWVRRPDAVAGGAGAVSGGLDRGEAGRLSRRGDAESAGSQPQELGRDVVTFQREDGVAENFHTEQNRQLLEQLASQTGGRYWKPSS